MTATLELGALDTGITGAGAAVTTVWHRVCLVDDLEPAWGEAALIAGRQIALFRTGTDEVFAVAHEDPATGAHVMARGILGSRGNRPTIASPLHKEVYDLETGECFSTPGLFLAAFSTRIVDGFVEVGL
jgi:nitrite reductase (NADH) small subunit